MVGYEWSGLRIHPLPCMGLRLLCLLLRVCAGFGPLSVRWFGLVVSLWLVLVLCLACWMNPTRCDPGRVHRLLGNGGVRVVLGMVLFIFFQLVLLRLGLGGILMLWLGLGLVCFFLVIWLVHFSILRLLFLMLGGTRLLLTFVAVMGFRGGPLLDVHRSLQLLNSSHSSRKRQGSAS